MTKLVLATRKSPLALTQTEMVAAHLRNQLGVETELLKIVTTGDKQTEWSLEKRGGKGLFTSELEAALLRGEADVAVHSTKDLPGDQPAGLAIGGYMPRADTRDVLVLRAGVETPKTIATGSPRRRLQVRQLFPDVEFTEIRGNVDTRLKKIGEQHMADGTILAAAGMKRLGIESWPGVEFAPLNFDQMVPAVGQGAIQLERDVISRPHRVGAAILPAGGPVDHLVVAAERQAQRAGGDVFALDVACQRGPPRAFQFPLVVGRAAADQQEGRHQGDPEQWKADVTHRRRSR